MPAHRLKIPPQVPLACSTGARGGSAVGRAAHGLPPPHGRHSVAADVPARLAQRLQRSRPKIHEQRRLCGRRATKRSDWRGGRAAASTSKHSVFSGPAPGLAGVRGGVRDARAPSAATCEHGPIAKRASVLHSRTDEEARDPRARDRAAACLSRLRRPDRVASGTEARQGARRRYPGGSMRSATARPRAAGRRPGPPRPVTSSTRCKATPLCVSIDLDRCFANFDHQSRPPGPARCRGSTSTAAAATNPNHADTPPSRTRGSTVGGWVDRPMLKLA